MLSGRSRTPHCRGAVAASCCGTLRDPARPRWTQRKAIVHRLADAGPHLIRRMHETVFNCSEMSDAGVPLVVGDILPIAAFSFADPPQAVDSLDTHYILFCLLVSELPYDPGPERRAVAGAEKLIVHALGEDRLRVIGVLKIDALIIGRASSEDRPVRTPVPSQKSSCMRI